MSEQFMCGAIPSQPDVRDFSVKAKASAAVPSKWKRSRYPKIVKQKVSNCTAAAAAYAYEMATGKEFSLGYLYGEREPTHYQGEGRVTKEVADTMLKHGNVLRADYPYEYEVNTAQMHVTARQDTLRKLAAEYKLDSYAKANSTLDIKSALMAGHGINFCGQCESFRADRNGIFRMREPTLGYHEMAICDWQDDMFYCTQSWGTGFGIKGFCWVPASDVLALRDVLVLDFAESKNEDGKHESIVRRTLRKGMVGNDVKSLQCKLSEIGHAIKVDGNFGSATRNEVKKFQRKNGLKADGVVGPVTWEVIDSYEQNNR